MENKSLWDLYMRKSYFPCLDKDIACDVLIIGGGITGITCGYFLRNSNLDVVLIEKDHVGSGASGHTTAKLTFMQELIYSKLDFKKASLYLDSQRDAIKIVKDIIKDNSIECNLEATNSYVFTDNINRINKFKNEEKVYDKLGIKYKTYSKLPIAFPSKYAIKTTGSYVFHPLKYLYSLKKIISNTVKIYENTKAIDIDKVDDYYVVKTENNKIKCKYVVVATQYPFFVNPYFLPFKTCVEKSYIVSGLVNKNKKFQAISDDSKHSIRYYSNKNKNYLIYVSNSHKITDNIFDKGNYKEVINKYNEYFDGDIRYYFLNQDIITLDSLPLIGRVNNSNLLIGTGYNTWGMTNGTIAGKVLSNIILGNDNKYISLFSLNRGKGTIGVKNLIIYNFSTIKRYVISKIKTNYKFYDDNVYVTIKNGIKYGVYIDKKKNKHIVKNVCPHLKCNLIFNSIDKTWDCPCHGSRFDCDGNLIFGPSVYDIKTSTDDTKDL